MNPAPGSPPRLEALFGPLAPAEASEVLADLEQRGRTLEEEEAAHALLLRTAAKAPLSQNAPVPPLPDALLLRLEGMRHVGAQAAQPERVQPPTPRQRASLRWPVFLTLAFGVTAALALAALFVFPGLLKPGSGTSSSTLAVVGSPRILTPAPETGFTRPTFTWKMESPFPLRAEIVDAQTGRTLASVDQALSPLRFDRLTAPELLPGRTYELRLSAGSGPLGSQAFRIAPNAQGTPVREPSLDGVIRQCETLLSQNRPGDAWMLWADLTEAEKADPRLQALKARIMGLIGCRGGGFQPPPLA